VIVLNPVSGDKILSQTSGRNSSPEDSRVERRQQDANGNNGVRAAAAKASNVSPDSVQVSRAGELFSQAADQTGRSNGAVNTSEQAAALAIRILQQFQDAPAAALKAQAGNQPDQYAYLLQTAPV
jgi:hypothetical protein